MSLVLVRDGGDGDAVLLNGVSNENTRRAYRRAWQRFQGWYVARNRGEISRLVMREYRSWLEDLGATASSINQELSAQRRMFRNAAEAGFVDRNKAINAIASENAARR
jgi:site-specific recombinase XerD